MMKYQVHNQRKAEAKILIIYNEKYHDLESVSRFIQESSTPVLALAVTKIKQRKVNR